MNIPKFKLTNESVTVIVDGEVYTAYAGSPTYQALMTAILSQDWEAIPKCVTTGKSLEYWAKGEFTVEGSSIFYRGEKIPDALNDRISTMAATGEDPSPLFKFWERLEQNPSFRSVQQLFPFLKHRGIPLTKDGCFLAYKSVRGNFKDHHSGTVDNSPGTVNEMPRNKISDDPNQACHYGFHVGAYNYASTFHSGSNIVICKVDPKDVVCVPYDASQEKMRVCRYEVIGHHGDSTLPSTTYIEDEAPWYGDYDEEEDEDLDLEDEYEEDEEDEEDFEEEAEVEEVEEEDLPPAPETRPDPERSIMDMSPGELMRMPIRRLRQIASRELRIVGASKIPGGKAVLISKIQEVLSRKGK